MLRVEDLDPPRVIAGAEASIRQDLEWLGMDWDEGPEFGGPHGPYHQSQRTEHYRRALQRLRQDGHLFDCSCSRREVAAASNAPHGELGPRYPGTCRSGVQRPGQPISIRFRMSPPAPVFEDGLHGTITADVCDDFIVRRSDGLFAYQLAVVADDAEMGITEVVRGDDLLSSTPRQLALFDALGAAPPRFFHIPLVLGPDGKRLAKRHGAIAIGAYRERGVAPEQIVGALAATLGIIPPGEGATPRELLTAFDASTLEIHPVRVSPDWIP